MEGVLFAVAAQKIARADGSGFARTFPFLSSRRGWAGRVWRGCGRRSRWFLTSPRIRDAGGTFEMRRESGVYGRPTTRRGTRADGRHDQRAQRWPVVLYRRGAEA